MSSKSHTPALTKHHRCPERHLPTSINSKSNLHHFRHITQKRETSSGGHLRGLAPGQHSSEQTPQRWRAASDTVSGLTGPGIKPQTSRTNSPVTITTLKI